jgi:mono/diheme cytochrome c family protein
VFDWSAPGRPAPAALGFLVAFWGVYDAICRAWASAKNGDRLVGMAVRWPSSLASYAACQLFAGRAAFLLVGAMIATAMSANVFFWIIPGQRKVVAQMMAGQPVDPVHGQRGKQRSVHNTYFTLPVLVAMLSNHYGWLYQGPHNWLVLVLLMLAGALIRHFFVARHKAHVLGRAPPWGYAVVGTRVMLVGLAMWLAPAPRPSAAQAASQPASFAQVQAVVEQRCVLCHNAQVQQKNVALHTPELLQQHALAVYQQAAVLKLMPLNNATQITDDERDLIRAGTRPGRPPADLQRGEEASHAADPRRTLCRPHARTEARAGAGADRSHLQDPAVQARCRGRDVLRRAAQRLGHRRRALERQGTRAAAELSMRAALALLLAALAAPASAQQLLDQPLAAGSTRTTVDLAVQAMAESRLALQFELRPAVQRAWLSPPDGRARELLPDRDLQRVPAAQRPRPERGDLLVLRQPPSDPAPGRWQLVLEHAAARRGDRLLGVVSQWPRFQLNLAWLGGAGPLRTGGEGLLDLRASDHGLPVAAASLQVSALHAASGQRLPLRAWSPRFEPAALPLQPEPGQTLVPFAPEQPAAGRGPAVRPAVPLIRRGCAATQATPQALAMRQNAASAAWPSRPLLSTPSATTANARSCRAARRRRHPPHHLQGPGRACAPHGQRAGRAGRGRQGDRVATLAWNGYRHMELYYAVSGWARCCTPSTRACTPTRSPTSPTTPKTRCCSSTSPSCR